MKILLDENLSPRLVQRLSDLFLLLSTDELALRRSNDREIWAYARRNQFDALLTSDGDFIALVEKHGPPPKVIRIANCNFRLRIIEELLRREAIRIQEFLDSDRAVLMLRI